MARTGLDAYYFRGIPLAATAPSNGDVYVYDSTSMTWIPGPAGGGAITGTIAVTQVAYGAGADEIKGEAAFTYDEGTNTLTAGTLNSTSLTASEILITDASKNVVSAAVATYPSLTELSYVKGVTSAIQTQIAAKAPLASPTFTGTVVIPTPFTLGATSVTSTGTQLNYLNAATGTTGTTSTNLVFSTSPTLVTPTLGVATATSITISTGVQAFDTTAETFTFTVA